MDWEAVIGILGAVLVATLAVAREWTATRGERSRIHDDLQILEKLPADGQAAKDLSEHIERAVVQMVTTSRSHRRDTGGLLITAFFICGTAWTVWAAATGTNWWLVPAAVLGMISIGGIGSSWPKVPRDERGRAIKPPSDPPTPPAPGRPPTM